MNETDNKKKISQPQKFEDWFSSFIKSMRPSFNKIWEVRKKLLIINASVFLVYFLYLFLIAKPYYESTVTILPDFGNKTPNFAGLSQLATLVGVRSVEGAPVEIYQNLVSSEAVLEEVIFSNYKTEMFNDSVNLIKYFNSRMGFTSPEKVSRATFLSVYESLLKNSIRTNIDRLTKILTLTVTMPESQLSADVANKIAESIDKYIRTKRKSYASEQRHYIEERIADLSDSLKQAEEKLKNFSEQNRLVIQSPHLLLEKGRLMRDVEIYNAVYVELNKQLEITKIDEIRETPVVNIKERAKDPVYKAGPARVSNLIKLLFLSLILTSFYYVFKERFIRYYKIVTGKQDL